MFGRKKNKKGKKEKQLSLQECLDGYNAATKKAEELSEESVKIMANLADIDFSKILDQAKKGKKGK